MENSDRNEATSAGNGKLAVLAMITVALAAASFAWWWNFNRGRKTLEFFGPQTARLIRTAPKVEILVIGGPESSSGPGSTDDKVLIGNVLFSVYRRIDISKAPGLIHARTSLLADSNYSEKPPTSKSLSYIEIVRFADDDGEAFIAITEPDGFVLDVQQGTIKRLIQKTADGWRQFLARNHPLPTPPAPARTAPSE
jgi:hypothetical protein